MTQTKKPRKFEIGDRVRERGTPGVLEVTGKDRSMVLLRAEDGGTRRVHYGKLEPAPEERPGVFDPDAEAAAGADVWGRRMGFDHKHITAECWYVIGADGFEARAFNTYSVRGGGRSLGRKNKESTVRVYDLRGRDLEKIQRRLAAKGYGRWEAGR